MGAIGATSQGPLAFERLAGQVRCLSSKLDNLGRTMSRWQVIDCVGTRRLIICDQPDDYNRMGINFSGDVVPAKLPRNVSKSISSLLNLDIE